MKRFISIILFILTMTLLFAQTSFAAERIEGQDRLSTAVEISKAGWDKSETVILANGYSFPDALSGGPLAYFYDAPILLTIDKKLPEVTIQEIERLKTKKVIILGGNVAVSEKVEQHLKNLGLEIERIGGQNRYETAALIANKLPSNQAVVVNGLTFPDALSIAPYAARNGIPILLGKENVLPEPTVKALKGKTKTIVIGGELAISKQVESLLPTPVRYSGQNRFDTGKSINENLPLGNEKAYIATGMNFADALTGSVLAAKHNAPILLVQTNKIPPSTKSILGNYDTKLIFGGPIAVSEEVKQEISRALDTFTARGISIDDSVQDVIKVLGQPDRIDESRVNFDWYIYNKDYSKFLMVGIANNKVVRLASNADVWHSTNGINIGTTKETVEKNLTEEYGVGEYYIEDSYFVRFYYDQHKDNSISLIEITGKDFKYFDPRRDDAVAQDIEKQIFDLANVTRIQFGLKPFKWDEKARISSRKHSQDMAVRDYFEHMNPDGESMVVRMQKEGIDLVGAAENIAAGYYNALDVHMGWMNSYGHRQNILSNLEFLGVGVAFGGSYGTYFTQNFYSSSW